jgi:hydrogenase maturation protein HypF
VNKNDDRNSMVAGYAARKLQVNGIVQGVGFRPFVYHLANRYGLKGEVANTSAGVSIHIEGPSRRLDSFESDLSKQGPPLAQIVEISSQVEPFVGYEDFRIVVSRAAAEMSTLISPDVSICEDCRRELFDPRDRRYGYPFINCTNCGPRYTIIDDIPYDRPKTSMRHFSMCAPCQAEYDDPENRRFHAQPNACADCGPQVSLFDGNKRRLDSDDPIKQAASLLRDGNILAIKGLGGFHLAVDASNPDAVLRLRNRKLREEKPFALMSHDLEQVEKFCVLSPAEQKLLISAQRPIVLLKQKKPNSIADEVSPRNKYFGVMLAYTPLHYVLLSHGFCALVMTSGNLSEEPIVIDNADAFERLTGIADFFLTHNRDIYLRSDDSIVRHTAEAMRYVRRSRGYVPVPIFLKEKLPPILAVGAELKNSICITKDSQAFLSQHVGDLENLSTYEFFLLTVDHLKRILEIEPQIIACDLHPDYLSTRFAQEQEGQQKVYVQHHHAHIVSCMAEHKLNGDVIGLSFDGTGYGTDGAIWGAEILVANDAKFHRVGQLDYVGMPGGAAAIKEPWRMAVAYLLKAFGDGFWDLDLPLLSRIERKKVDVVVKMIAREVNCPQTSSLGRLFDGVAAIIGLRHQVNFEGQAAMELEMLADDGAQTVYNFEWDYRGGLRILPVPIIRAVVHDFQMGVSAARISARFHNTLIRLFTELCTHIRKERELNRVVLSGGCFQNSILLAGLIRQLQKNRFEVFAHEQVPCNDGGIALGQAVVAAAISQRI